MILKGCEMEKFPNRTGSLLIFIVLLLCVGQIQAQTAKPKATPKTKATPANTVTNSPSALDSAVWSEINALRANPGSYIKYLEELRANFNGTTLNFADGTRLITNEGVVAVNDAISSLKSAKPVGSFKMSAGLVKAASEHLQDMIKNNFSGHKGSDGSWPPNRADRQGFWSGEVKENISYRTQSARDILLNMLLDDGNPKRDHRKNLLSSNLKFAGLAVGDGKTYGRLCVVVFANEFTEKRFSK
jgi:uncharacterized protein YkwD